MRTLSPHQRAVIVYYGTFLAFTLCIGAGVGGIADLSLRAARIGSGNIPSAVGALDPQQPGYMNNVLASCASILLGYLNPQFARAARWPTDPTNATAIMMMQVLQFVCGGLPNVTVGNATFFAANGPACRDVVAPPSAGGAGGLMASHNASIGVAPPNNGVPSSNTGGLRALFELLAQLTGSPLLNLECTPNSSYMNYAVGAGALAVFVALLLACAGCTVRYGNRPACRQQPADDASPLNRNPSVGFAA